MFLLQVAAVESGLHLQIHCPAVTIMKALFLLAMFLSGLIAYTHAAERPNILVIIADDLGYADIGVHGGKSVPTVEPPPALGERSPSILYRDPSHRARSCGKTNMS